MNDGRIFGAGHRSSSGVESDADSENLPPIPVQGNDSLGSPYENVRPGDDLSPAEGTSPTQWQFYHKPRDDDRRVSGTSVMSLWVSCRPFLLLTPPLLSMYIPPFPPPFFFCRHTSRNNKMPLLRSVCDCQAARNKIIRCKKLYWKFKNFLDRKSLSLSLLLIKKWPRS